MATQTIARQINEQKTLAALYLEGPKTRAEIARSLGVTKSTAASVIASLEQEGMVETNDTNNGARLGRPGTFFGLKTAGAYFLGAEIGVGHINLAVLDLTAKIICDRLLRIDCRKLSPDEALDQIVANFNDLCREAQIEQSRMKGMGLSVPGIVNRDGVMLNAPRLGWKNIRFKSLLVSRFSCLASVDNDANLSAFAEWYFGTKLDGRELLLILLDEGIGAGLVESGRIVRGANGFAGEVGHMHVGERILDGFNAQSLIWEDVIGTAALLSAYSKHIGETCELTDFERALAAGNARAMEIGATWSKWLARGIAALAFAYDPSEIVISGELTPIFVAMREVVEAEVAALLHAEFPAQVLSASRFQSNGCAIGAAATMHAGFFSTVGAQFAGA